MRCRCPDRSLPPATLGALPRGDRALQGALLGLVGLILAFGLTLAVGRYQDRRADVVNEANTIGTAYLGRRRLQSPSAAARSSFYGVTTTSRSGSPTTGQVTHRSVQPPPSRTGCNRCCGGSAGEAINARPRDSAPRLYIDSLNAMIDQQGVRIAGLNNHPPNAVLLLELFGKLSPSVCSRSTSRFSAVGSFPSSLQQSSSPSWSSLPSTSTDRPVA